MGLHNRYEHILNTQIAHLAKGKNIPEEQVQRLTAKFESMMHALHKEQGSSLRIQILAEPEVQSFINEHAAILDSSYQDVNMSNVMRERLNRSDYIFSGIKTFHELHEAFPKLTDENGNRKPFNDFYNDVQKIDSTYNRNYLHSEYNFVNASADMAAKWERFAQDGDRYNLQYRTVGDDRVREEHAGLDGITLPIDDPFWHTYYPPNGWNCRCTVVQVLKDKYEVTPHAEAMAMGEAALQTDSKGIFRFNSGIQRKAVPDYNPYTIKRCNNCDIAKGKLSLAKAPDNELCAACRLLRSFNEKDKKRIEDNKKQYRKYRSDHDYKNVKFDKTTGGLMATHIKHNFDKTKGWYEELAQTTGFKNGHVVILEEESHNIFKQRNCEGLWDGKKFEIAAAETVETGNIRNALKHCAKKPDSEIAVIVFPEKEFNLKKFNDGYYRYLGLKGTKQYKKFDMIYCISKDYKIIYKKKPS